MLRAIDISAMPVPGRPSEKTAFLGALLGTAGKALSLGARKFGPTGLAKFTNPLAQRAENAVVSGATNFLKTDPTKTRQLMRGVVHKTIRDTAGGALAGGVFSGGINAMTAEPGERGSAFAKGFGSGALSGAGFGAATGLGGGLVRNAQGMHFQNLAKTTGISSGRIATRSKQMGFRDTFGKAFKQPDAMNPMGKVDQGIARAKLLGGLGLVGAELGPDAAVHGLSSGGSPPPPPPQSPQFQPNAPAVYSQPQYYKSSSAKTQLRPIDFTNLPSYHR